MAANIFNTVKYSFQAKPEIRTDQSIKHKTPNRVPPVLGHVNKNKQTTTDTI